MLPEQVQKDIKMLDTYYPGNIQMLGFLIERLEAYGYSEEMIKEVKEIYIKRKLS